MRVTPGISVQIALRTLAAGLAAGVLASCSVLIDRQLPAPDCPETHFEPAPALSCEAAVQAAVDSLGSTPAIMALSFQYGALCPPNARCVMTLGNSGVVIVTFTDGARVSVFARIDAGRLLVEAAETYPPPGWEL